YGNRTLESILFGEELEDLKDRHLGRFTLLHVLSRNEEGGAPVLEGRIGRDKVLALARGLFVASEVAHVYLCGPGSMIAEVRRALLELGVARARIHHEFFAPVGAHAAAGTPPFASRPGETRDEETTPSAAGATLAIAVLDGIRHHFSVPRGGHV